MPPVIKICGARLSGHTVVEEKSTINIRGYMMCACVGSVWKQWGEHIDRYSDH